MSNEELANSEKLRIYLANKEKTKKEMNKNKIIFQNPKQFQNQNLKSEKNLVNRKQENNKDGDKLLNENSKNFKSEWNNDYSNNCKTPKKESLKISKYDSSNRTVNNSTNRKYDNKKSFIKEYESSEKISRVIKEKKIMMRIIHIYIRIIKALIIKII